MARLKESDTSQTSLEAANSFIRQIAQASGPFSVLAGLGLRVREPTIIPVEKTASQTRLNGQDLNQGIQERLIVDNSIEI